MGAATARKPLLRVSLSLSIFVIFFCLSIFVRFVFLFFRRFVMIHWETNTSADPEYDVPDGLSDAETVVYDPDEDKMQEEEDVIIQDLPTWERSMSWRMFWFHSDFERQQHRRLCGADCDHDTDHDPCFEQWRMQFSVFAFTTLCGSPIGACVYHGLPDDNGGGYETPYIPW